MTLTLYTRRGCHLCEDFEAELRRVQGELAFEVLIRDVDARPDWAADYGDKVPLLLARDMEICRYFFDPQALRSYLAGGAA